MSACGSAQSREARYIHHGQMYFSAGNYDKARVEFSNAAQIDPKDATVRYLLGQVAEKLGDVRAAVSQYQAAVGQDPKLAEARAALARIYLYAGLPDKALELVAPGLAAEPNNAQLLTVRGAARSQLGDAKQAMQDAQTAVRLAPADDYAVALLASLYRQQNQLEKAADVVVAGLRQLPKNTDLRVILADLYTLEHRPADAEAQLRQIIALQPKALVNRYRLARFYVQQKQIDAAEQVLREAVRTAPRDLTAKLQLVTFLSAQRGRDQAVKQTEQLLADDPHNDQLALELGQFLVQIGQADRAEQEFKAVIARAGTDPAGLSARDQLAALLLGGHDAAGANALIAQVLQQNGRDSDALIMRSSIALTNGDAPDAIVDLRAVLRDQPNAVALMRTLAQAYLQNGEVDLAEQTLRSAVQAAPRDFDSRLALARVLIATQQANQASALLEQLAKEDPNNLPVQQTLFQAQAAQKQEAAARVTAQLIERIAPKQALGDYLEGLIDESDGQLQAAAQHYQSALQLQPVSADALSGLVRLDLRRKQPEAALALLNPLIVQYPKDALPPDLKGQVLVFEGQMEPAITAFQTAIQLAPQWPKPYSDLGATQILAKHRDDAIHTLQVGVERTSADENLLSHLSSLYEQSGHPDEAITLYQGVLAKNPKSVFAANNLAVLLVTYRHDAQSLAQARKLADQLASFSLANVIDTRGWVKFKSGDYHGAESLLQEAVDKSPGSSELRYHLAMAQLRSGEPQAAQQNLESALHSAQPFEGMDDARAALTRLLKGSTSG